MPRRDHKGCCWSLELSSHFSGRAFFLAQESWEARSSLLRYARALGFTYNGARAMSSVAPLVIGRVGQAKGLSWAFYWCAAGYLLAAAMTTQLPETKGKRLEGSA